MLFVLLCCVLCTASGTAPRGCWLCSTSLPGGNQVDGLPPAPSLHSPRLEFGADVTFTGITLDQYKTCSTSYKLGAGGKPSTWLPPGRLVEHNSNPRGAVAKHDCVPENTIEEPTMSQPKSTNNNYLPSPTDKNHSETCVTHNSPAIPTRIKEQDPRRARIMTPKIQTQQQNNSATKDKQYFWRTQNNNCEA